MDMECRFFDHATGLCECGLPCDDCRRLAFGLGTSQAEHSQPEKGVSGNATEREE